MAKIVLKKRRVSIPQASMSDIAFLLLLFFMVTTVFVQEKAFWVERNRWPMTDSVQKIPRNHTSTVYVRPDDTVLIDDIPYSIEDMESMKIAAVMQRKLDDDSGMIVCFRTDRDAKYGIMADVMRQLQDIGALKVTFETQKNIE